MCTIARLVQLSLVEIVNSKAWTSTRFDVNYSLFKGPAKVVQSLV